MKSTFSMGMFAIAALMAGTAAAKVRRKKNLTSS